MYASIEFTRTFMSPFTMCLRLPCGESSQGMSSGVTTFFRLRSRSRSPRRGRASFA